MKHELLVTALDKEQVYNCLYKAAHQNAYTAYIRGNRCKTESDFFHEVSAAFQFPWYFGENWAAFDECMCDLEWLRFQQLFVVIDDFSAMFQGNDELQSLLKKYLGIIYRYWNDSGILISIWLNN